MWDGQMEAFARRYRVIRYDQHGYGESATPSGPVAFHEDLRAFLGALGISRAHILGLSYGARVATNFAVTHPEMVSSLISVSSVIGGFSDETWGRIEKADEIGEAGDLDRAVDMELQIWIDGVGRPPEAVAAGVREHVREMNRAVWERSAETEEVVDLDPPAEQRLAEIRVPVLIVVGAHDVPDVQATADLLQRLIPGARYISIPGAAHHPQMEQPEAFNEAVLGFLATV